MRRRAAPGRRARFNRRKCVLHRGIAPPPSEFVLGSCFPLGGSRAPRELAVRRPSRTAAGRCGGRHSNKSEQCHCLTHACTMHGNHVVGLVKPKLSKRERKRQSALEEKNKAAAICWWFNCTCARVAFKEALAVCEDEEEWPEGRPARRVCVFFDSRSRGDGDVEGSLQWTPATTLTTALKTFGSRTSEAHNCTHEVFAAGCVCTD
jgi:hypothetical protein